MKKLFILALVCLLTEVLSTGALAEDNTRENIHSEASLYTKKGDTTANITYKYLYATAANQNITAGGIGVRGSYFITDEINISAEYMIGSLSTPTNSTYKAATALVNYHMALTPHLKGIIGIGYTRANLSGSGLAYELGIENKFMDNMASYLAVDGGVISVAVAGQYQSKPAIGMTMGFDYLF